MFQYALPKIYFLIFSGICLASADQEDVDYIAKYINITYTCVDNFVDEWRLYAGKITFINVGLRDIESHNWSIYFSSIRPIEPDSIYPNGTELGNSGLIVHHIGGYLHKLQPSRKFKGFVSYTPVDVSFKGKNWVISKTDIMPNWYVTSADSEPKTIQSTEGESLSFVSDFNEEKKWKRQPYDKYDPYTPEKRFLINGVNDLKMIPKKVIPTPMEEGYHDLRIKVNSDWVIVQDGEDLEKEVKYLADRMKLNVVGRGEAPDSQYVWVSVGLVLSSSAVPLVDSEAYSLDMGQADKVIITGVNKTGVFYAIQTLLSLLSDPLGMPQGYVIDLPRFPYRGMHMDVSRNFHGKEDVKRVLEAMAMYKMNKFHFHLSDDEGWRLHIADLPELAEVGGVRCHDLTETNCLLPQLGSAPVLPNTGSGYYTQDDYREILSFASDRHIQIIPEFDMPGHGRAAIVSMLARFKKYNLTEPEKATQFLLSDLEDQSEYMSIQSFSDNAINPCIESTYTFVDVVIRTLVEYHKDIQPLRIFHFGGDEVPDKAWKESPACKKLMENNPELRENKDLKRRFVQRVSELAHKHGVDLAGWEDGLMDGNTAYNRSAFPNQNVYGYFWDNVWEWGHGQRAYVGANAGFKGILSHATHLYFDFPYEPDPEERGYYWATRVIDTRKAFGYTPIDIYDNIDVDRMGSPLDKEKICKDFSCTPLENNKQNNIIGMQGQLWSETVRTSEQLDYMLFPRLLAVAERAWHTANWERVEVGPERESLRQQDWEQFANTLGHKELARLEAIDIHHHVPPPGARVTEYGDLIAESAYPGLRIEQSVDNGSSWNTFVPGKKLEPGVIVYMRTRSPNLARYSRGVMLTIPAMTNKTQTIPPLMSNVAPEITTTHLVHIPLPETTSTPYIKVVTSTVDSTTVSHASFSKVPVSLLVLITITKLL